MFNQPSGINTHWGLSQSRGSRWELSLLRLWEGKRRKLGRLDGEALSCQGALDAGLPSDGKESRRTWEGSEEEMGH